MPETRLPERPAFGSRLRAAMDRRGPLCVGIDPHPGLLAAWGLTDDAAGLERFSLTVLEAVGEQAAALKPQVALFERHGSAGMAVLERLLAACREASVLSIADAKRGDIGSTMEAYADAWLRDGSPLAADAVTLSPYLGFGSLRPALDLASATGRGVFVLALTSNPEGASVQHAGGRESVAGSVVDAAGRENAAERAAAGGPGPDPAAASTSWLGSTGLVVGATTGTALRELDIDLASSSAPLLAPGLGAQGATGADLARTFGPAFGQVLASSSRDILQAGPDRGALSRATARTLAGIPSPQGPAAP